MGELALFLPFETDIVMKDYLYFTGFTHVLNKPLPPSGFASNWALQQQGPAAIDCLRPTDRIGLPISLLHPAFAKFLSIIDQPIPYDREAAAITNVAHQLCSTMSHEFTGDNTRLTALLDQFEPVFFKHGVPRPVKVTFGTGTPAGSMLMPNGSVKTIVEEKPEPGRSGDVYMQSARSFDLVARTRPADEQEKTGCAAFVISLDGKSSYC
jgi:hypothetical protein